jgi:hypothetical protein
VSRSACSTPRWRVARTAPDPQQRGPQRRHRPVEGAGVRRRAGAAPLRHAPQPRAGRPRREDHDTDPRPGHRAARRARRRRSRGADQATSERATEAPVSPTRSDGPRKTQSSPLATRRPRSRAGGSREISRSYDYSSRPAAPSNATAAPEPGFGELLVPGLRLMALSATCERLVRLIELVRSCARFCAGLQARSARRAVRHASPKPDRSEPSTVLAVRRRVSCSGCRARGYSAGMRWRLLASPCTVAGRARRCRER